MYPGRVGGGDGVTMPVSELPPEKLRLVCPPGTVNCESTADLAPTSEVIGQDRALRALKFGLHVKGKGFNIYAAGEPGSGKNVVVRRYLESVAKEKPTPADWCYVNDFRNPYEPRALRFPPGRVRGFQRDVKSVVDQVQRVVPAALASEDLTARQDVVAKQADDERRRILEAFSKEAAALGFAVQVTPSGIGIVPARNGRALTPEEVQTLPPGVRNQLEKNGDAVREQFEKVARQLAELDLKTRDAVRAQQDQAVHFAIDHLLGSLTAAYKDVPGVTEYLTGLRDDILEHAEAFAEPEGEGSGNGKDKLDPEVKAALLRRYDVNVIVDNADTKGAPIVYEANPTYNNLFGRVQNEARMGMLSTDFTLIKGGAIHRANGGYLLLRIDELAKNPASYDGLKRALQSGEILIEETGERLGMSSTKTLAPEPIPLDVKVIVIGDPSVYTLLYTEDPDFPPLFKVKAQFDESIPRNAANVEMYGRFLNTLCTAESLRHLDAGGVAKVVEHGSRLAEDQAKLSTRFSEIADLVREADFYAGEEGAQLIADRHIVKALQEKIYRSNLADEKTKEMVARGVLLIDTAGASLGQVNGLAVLSLGDFEFGQPSRVTASIGLGRDGIIDIERESKLGGQIHTKGVLILSGFLADRYARDKPLSLACRLVFEQSYGGVDGDSASSTELYAILSALSGVPIRQNLAVTGSVNQKGEVQAIGGANEKIEGFYHVCKAKGLRGDEGVMIPASNVQHLMLDEEVVDAVRQGKFHIYAVRTIDEGIEVLTGVKAGARLPDGGFESGSINDRVSRRLAEMAETLGRFAGAGPGAAGKP